MKSHELISVRVIQQRHGMDCLICCLAMLLGTSYEAALLAVSKVKQDSGTEGLSWKDAERAAEQLGAHVRLRRKYSPDETVGIVDLVPKTKRQPNHHAALLLRGTLIDPAEPMVYDDWELFEQTNDFRLGAVLVQKTRREL